MDLRKVGYEGVVWIQLAQRRVQLGGTVNNSMKAGESIPAQEL
jgi:cell wall assembly regulator SMI1